MNGINGPALLRLPKSTRAARIIQAPGDLARHIRHHAAIRTPCPLFPAHAMD
jgi:hypothetical protein